MPLNTQMGLGHDHFDPALGAQVSDYRFSESNHREFYRRWSELMAAKSWRTLSGEQAREVLHA
jgi:3-phenylpropionate/trans-cinnamate dioxygenase alpha subunit